MAASTGAIKAGQAFVGLALDQSEFVKGLETAQKRLKTFAGYMARTGVAIGAAGGAITAPLVKFFADALDRGSNLKVLSDRLGETVESTSTLATGFEAAGVNLEEFGGVMGGLRSKITAAADANGELIDGMRGLNGRTLLGKGVDTQLDAIAESFTRITLASDQAEQAEKLGLTSILPYLKKGKAGIDELRAAGAKGMISKDEAERSNETMKAYTETWQSLKYTLLDVGKAFLPTSAQIQLAMGWVRKATTSTRDFIEKNQTLIMVIGGIGAALVAAGVALVTFGYAAALAGTLISAVIATISAVATVGGILSGISLPLLAIVAGVALLAAGLAGLGYLFVTETEAGQAMFAALSDDVTAFGALFKTTYGGIVEAVQKGDLSLAFEIAMAGIDVAWKRTSLKLTAGWTVLKDDFVDGWHNMITAVKLIFSDFGGWLAKQMGSVMKPVFDLAAEALDLIGDKRGADAFRKVGGLSPEQMDEARDKVRAGILGDAAGEQKERTDFRNDQIAGAMNQLKAAEQALAELTAKAKAENPAQQAEAVAKFLDKKGGGGKAGDPFGISALSEHVKGLTSGPANLQLAYGDTTAKRQLDAQEDIAKNAKVLPEIAGAMKDLNAGLRFK
jgi:hypothetical protein